MFDSIRTLTDATFLASAIFIGVHALRAFSRFLNYSIELLLDCAKKTKAAGLSIKAIGANAARFGLNVFDAFAPMFVLAYGAGVIILNFGMLGFVPDLTFMEIASAEIIAVSLVWRSLEAYIQHVQRKRDALKPAWKPQKKG